MSKRKLKQLSTKGKRIYKKLLRRLLPKHKGQIIAIEPESGRYFMGHDELKVALKAMKSLPGRIFSVFRIGHAAVHKFRKFP